MDTESQCYPRISFTLRGDEEDTRLIQYFRIISFHEESSTPPPLSSIWNIKYP